MQDSEGGDTRKDPVKWSTAAARKVWESIDIDVDQVIGPVLDSKIGRRWEQCPQSSGARELTTLGQSRERLKAHRKP